MQGKSNSFGIQVNSAIPENPSHTSLSPAQRTQSALWLDRSQSDFYFVPQESHSQAGSTSAKTMLRTRTSMRVACKEGEGENPELWRHVENRKRSDKGHRVKNVDHAGQHFPRRDKV